MFDVKYLNNQDWQEIFESLQESGKKYGSILVGCNGRIYELSIKEVGFKSGN
ncbi:hypothetical protein Si135_00053 [Streptococcus infantarius subsp. infantarius]|nr:hypothetical protein [Streptococcus infantarius subsp. infantarius]